MAVRTGAEYIDGLNDARVVYFGKDKVSVTQEPAFAGSLKGMAGYFDWQNQHAGDCIVEDPETGEAMNASHLIPRNQGDITARHKCFERLARYSYGMLGRTPDYCNASLAGQIARSDIWAKGEPRFYEHLKQFRRDVIAGDRSLTHTLVNATIDKGSPEFEGCNEDLGVRVVKRDANGITVRGAKLLATLGPFADELFVYPSAPLAKDKAEFALCFAIPVATKGIIQLCRDHYGLDSPVSDRPFSSRFDEQDAFVIFDDVEIPWERVFVDGNLDIYNALSPGVFPGAVYQQTSLRALVKLEFAYDLCVQMARIQNSENRPDVAQKLGDIYSYICMTRSAIHSAEARAHDWGGGAFFLHRDIAAVRTFMPVWMLQVNEIIETLGAHHLLTTPTAELFDNPEISGLLEKYLPSADGRTAQDRSKVFRTAWDFAGSALGSRVQLYERYYLGSRDRARQVDHRTGQSSRQWTVFEDFKRDVGM